MKATAPSRVDQKGRSRNESEGINGTPSQGQAAKAHHGSEAIKSSLSVPHTPEKRRRGEVYKVEEEKVGS